VCPSLVWLGVPGPGQVIYWLSGLTCTDENFIQKSFAQKFAADHGVALAGTRHLAP